MAPILEDEGTDEAKAFTTEELEEQQKNSGLLDRAADEMTRGKLVEALLQGTASSL